MKPYHKLRPKEIEALSLILYYEHELKMDVNSQDLVTRLLFSPETRHRIKDELGNMPNTVFNNLLSQLRKKGVLTKENEINEALRPPMDITDDNFQLVFNFELKDDSNKK